MKNWTIKEAVAAIRTGTDQEAIKELAKHFPMFFIAVAQNNLDALAAMMTDKMTVRRLEVGNGSEDSDSADEEATAADSEQDDADGDTDLNELSTKQLIALCGKRGIKVPKYGKNKAFYIAALENGATGNNGDNNDGGDEDDANDDPYRGKNALQLYSMCKKRNLKVEPRQKAIVYLEALKAADAASADDAEDEDEAEEEVKPAKPASKKAASKKAAPKPKKEEAKPAKSESDDDDDDDDWDI